MGAVGPIIYLYTLLCLAVAQHLVNTSGMHVDIMDAQKQIHSGPEHDLHEREISTGLIDLSMFCWRCIGETRERSAQ